MFSFLQDSLHNDFNDTEAGERKQCGHCLCPHTFHHQPEDMSEKKGVSFFFVLSGRARKKKNSEKVAQTFPRSHLTSIHSLLLRGILRNKRNCVRHRFMYDCSTTWMRAQEA